MTCEWTHHLSYDPGLVAVSIGHTKTIVENIRALKEFAVNLCVSDQSILSSVAGGYSGSKYDKISALKELGFQFYDAKKIKTLMVKGASLNMECKSMYWSSPTMLFEPSLEEGPVLVKIEYKIDKEHQQQNDKIILYDFLNALRDLSKIRKRDGAIQWAIYRDGADPNNYVETFVVESWAEHLRQHERLTDADLKILNKVRSFHIGDKPPIVTHYVAEPFPNTKYSIVNGRDTNERDEENNPNEK